MILERATEIWFQDQFKSGIMNPNTPEINELKECGVWAQAISELMMDQPKHEVERFEEYIRNVENFERKQESKIDGQAQEIPFDVKEAMASAFYCCGTRQLSGKTNLVKQLVKRLISNGIRVFVIDPSLAQLTNTPIHNFFRVPRGNGETTIKRVSTVFDVSKLGYGERFAFVKNFCKTLTDSHTNGYPFPEMVVFEECHCYLPNGCMRSKKYSDIVDFCTIGGNYGLSFGAVTQFSASVDKAIVKLAQQRFFGLTTEDNDKRYVKSFIGKKWMNELIRLQLGQFLYQNRATIQKFQCQKFGSATANGFSYQYNFPMVS